MTGFLLTVAAMIGVMITLPFWRYSERWGNVPCYVMSLATLVIGWSWLNKWI